MKPENESDVLRVLEKLEIERVWWELLGIKFTYYVGNELTQIQSSNINWVTHPLRTDDNTYNPNSLGEALALITLGKHFKRDICNLFVSEMNVPHEEALNILRSLIGEKILIVDITYPLENSDFINILSINAAQEGLAIGNF